MEEKKKTEYHLPFVNDDKPFTLSPWTTGKHKAVLKEVAKYEKSMSEKELDGKYRNILILKGLHEVDPNVTEENLESLHPNDLVALFTAVYHQGMKGIVVREVFRGTKKKNLLKK